MIISKNEIYDPMDDHNILFVGPKGKGGIKAVTDTYSTEFKPFKIIYSQRDGSRMTKTAFAFTAYVRFIITLLKDRKIKVVHIHSSARGSFWRKAIFIRIALKFKKKVIFHSHSGSFKDFYNSNSDKVRKILDRCDVIVALSEQWKSFFNSIGYISNCIVINNPIVAPSITPRATDNIKHILFLGKICPEKGVFDMLDMIIAHKSDLEGKVCFHIAGNDQIDRLNNIINEHGLSSLVKYEGWVTGEQKNQLFNDSDMFILPSYIEGVPVSILEAMSYGLPVIATDVGGVASVVTHGQNGLFITPGDKEQMFEAIKLLLNDEAYKNRLVANALETCENYKISRVKESLSQLYANLIDK